MKLPSINSRTRIWEAAYAAAFVRAFDRSLPHTHFDNALANNAEQAITVANAAVDQLVAWIKQEGPLAMGR